MLIALWTLYPILYFSILHIIWLYQKDIHSNAIKFSVSQGEENVSPKKSTQPFWGVSAPQVNGKPSLPYMLYQERWDWPFRHIAHIPTLHRQTIQGRCVGGMLMEGREWQFTLCLLCWDIKKKEISTQIIMYHSSAKPRYCYFLHLSDILYNYNRYFIILYKHFLLYQLTSNYWQWNGKATMSIHVDRRRNSVLALDFCSVAPLAHSKGCLQLWVPDIS